MDSQLKKFKTIITYARQEGHGHLINQNIQGRLMGLKICFCKNVMLSKSEREEIEQSWIRIELQAKATRTHCSNCSGRGLSVKDTSRNTKRKYCAREQCMYRNRVPVSHLRRKLRVGRKIGAK